MRITAAAEMMMSQLVVVYFCFVVSCTGMVALWNAQYSAVKMNLLAERQSLALTKFQYMRDVDPSRSV